MGETPWRDVHSGRSIPGPAPCSGWRTNCALREAAGSPTYRAMAERAGVGASTLSQAAAGERLPTLPVVLAYARACGGRTAGAGPTGGARWGAFGRGGRMLATGGAGHDVRLWDISSPARATALGNPLIGHTSAVTWVGFSPDGRTLLSAGEDRILLLWNVTDPAHATAWGRALTVGHTDAIETAVYRPDGQLLATAGADRAIELTPLGLGGAVRRICASTATLLTPAQWRQYIPELPYDAPCRGR